MSADDVYPEPSPQEGCTLVAESEPGASADFLNVHHPDVLLCLANLSNDEVFTPPKVVNAMLDLLPERLWRDPTVTFLDPYCKSGVFLREIAKRLIVGLVAAIPDLQARLDHIFTRQLFGLAITDLTALLSRRSVYCSKVANGRYSLTRFSSAEGNIRLPHSHHTWKDGRCERCGASQAQYDRPGREAHAYAFIHGLNPEELFKMKFDVFIGNPPYQLDDGGNGASASPIYQKFVQVAKKLSPSYISFIIPSRWFSGGKGLDDFRKAMLNDRHVSDLHDYLDSIECFGTGVEIKGGVCYFLWDKSHDGPCRITTHEGGQNISCSERYLKEEGLDTFVRHQIGLSILEKVRAHGEPSFASLVSPRRPFGLDTTTTDNIKALPRDVRLYQNGGIGYISLEKLPKGCAWIEQWKVYISKAYGAGETYPHQILGVPLLGSPKSACTETYLLIGPFASQKEAKNVQRYIATRFFRFLVHLLKNTQDATARVYALVPLQDFSEAWTDEKLYRKYGLTAEEIAFIERMVKPMET